MNAAGEGIRSLMDLFGSILGTGNRRPPPERQAHTALRGPLAADSLAADRRPGALPPATDRTPPPPEPPIAAWAATLSSSLVILRRLAGATEREFLQIGSDMQAIYLRAATLSQTAQDLVEVASGDRVHSLIAQLRQILAEMETYLEQTQVQNGSYCTAFATVEKLLQQIADPLEGFKKMSKNLYILEVLIKIESANIGELGGEFINLALDINTLTQQIKDKSNTIQDHRSLLAAIIAKNSQVAGAALTTQEGLIRSTLDNTVTSIAELEGANQRFFELGSTVATTADDNSNNISKIVQSMQFHDIFRQQVEHVIEALEGLQPALAGNSIGDQDPADNRIEALINRVGDACELQEAQLQYATTALYMAVTAIISNLTEISGQQKLLARDIYNNSGLNNGTGRSFIDDVSFHMASITELLTSCAATNSDLAGIMAEVTDTVETITGFVADIEGIGHDINLIALNARIKAASTGADGASLCVLAEEIGHLSHGDAQRTDIITATLREIHTTTSTLFAETTSGEANLSARLIDMKTGLNTTLVAFAQMGSDLQSLLAQVQNQVNTLTGEIERITGAINVHQHCRDMADEVVAGLQQIFAQARALSPASAAFKEDLRLMANRYTMESERKIHEGIAQKHGLLASTPRAPVATSPKTADSEFGDNVDLF